MCDIFCVLLRICSTTFFGTLDCDFVRCLNLNIGNPNKNRLILLMHTNNKINYVSALFWRRRKKAITFNMIGLTSKIWISILGAAKSSMQRRITSLRKKHKKHKNVCSLCGKTMNLNRKMSNWHCYLVLHYRLGTEYTRNCQLPRRLALRNDSFVTLSRFKVIFHILL